MIFKKVDLIICSLTLLGLSACAITPERHLGRAYEQQIQAGQSPSYAEGYSDGCSSGWYLEGNREFPYRRDAMRTQNDSAYVRGWAEGHRVCLMQAKKTLAKSKSRKRFFYQQSEVDLEGPGPSRYEYEQIRPNQDDIYRDEQEAIWEELRK